MAALPSLSQVIAHVESCQRVREEMFDALADTGHALAIMLYIDREAAVRDRILEGLSPKAREVVETLTESIREVLAENKRQELSP